MCNNRVEWVDVWSHCDRNSRVMPGWAIDLDLRPCDCWMICHWKTSSCQSSIGRTGILAIYSRTKELNGIAGWLTLLFSFSFVLPHRQSDDVTRLVCGRLTCDCTRVVTPSRTWTRSTNTRHESNRQGHHTDLIAQYISSYLSLAVSLVWDVNQAPTQGGAKS